MGTNDVAAAIQRARNALSRRPDLGAVHVEVGT
jgi:hypothetical protein